MEEVEPVVWGSAWWPVGRREDGEIGDMETDKWEKTKCFENCFGN